MGPGHRSSATLRSQPSDNLSIALSTWKPVSKAFLPNHQHPDSLCKLQCRDFLRLDGSHHAATPSASPHPPHAPCLYPEDPQFKASPLHIHTDCWFAPTSAHQRVPITCPMTTNQFWLGQTENFYSGGGTTSPTGSESLLSCPPLGTLPQPYSTI